MSYDEPREIERFIWGYCGHLLTEFERAVHRVALFQGKRFENRAHAEGWYRRLDPASWDDSVRAAAADFVDFSQQAVRRVLAEHGDGILNRCPNCRAVRRTPRARFCMWCLHDERSGQLPNRRDA